MNNNRQRAEALLPGWTNKTSAQSIASSVTEYGIDTRLDSIYGLIPKMVLGERNRHRGFSLSDRSSRAVPPERYLEEVRSGEGLAMPAKFRRRTTGMGGGEELTGDELIEAQVRWIHDALDAADATERAIAAGEEKETANRRLDSYVYTHTLQTATRAIWLNTFGLRLANASPTFELYALRCFEAYRTVTPRLLRPGEWHRPFVDNETEADKWLMNLWGVDADLRDEDKRPKILNDVSAARCAHLSYRDLATGQRMTIERALSICTTLRDSRPLHASPFEHQATPDEVQGWSEHDAVAQHSREHRIPIWKNPYQHGNLYGWRQARKMIPGEAVAALPEGFEL